MKLIPYRGTAYKLIAIWCIGTFVLYKYLGSHPLTSGPISSILSATRKLAGEVGEGSGIDRTGNIALPYNPAATRNKYYRG